MDRLLLFFGVAIALAAVLANISIWTPRRVWIKIVALCVPALFLPAAYLNVVDMLTHRDLLLTEAAVRAVEGLWGSAAAEAAPVEEPKPRRRRARVSEKPAEEAEAQPEPKPRRRRAVATPKVVAAKDEAPAKPARRAGRPKAEAKEEPKPAARRRTRTKKEEG